MSYKVVGTFWGPTKLFDLFEAQIDFHQREDLFVLLRIQIQRKIYVFEPKNGWGLNINTKSAHVSLSRTASAWVRPRHKQQINYVHSH